MTSASIPSGARQPDLAEVGTLRPGGGAPRGSSADSARRSRRPRAPPPWCGAVKTLRATVYHPTARQRLVTPRPLVCPRDSSPLSYRHPARQHPPGRATPGRHPHYRCPAGRRAHPRARHRRAQVRRPQASAVGAVHGQRRLAGAGSDGPQPRPRRRPVRRTRAGPGYRNHTAPSCSPCPAALSTPTGVDDCDYPCTGHGPTRSNGHWPASTRSHCAADHRPPPRRPGPGEAGRTALPPARPPRHRGQIITAQTAPMIDSGRQHPTASIAIGSSGRLESTRIGSARFHTQARTRRAACSATSCSVRALWVRHRRAAAFGHGHRAAQRRFPVHHHRAACRRPTH